MPSYKEPLIWSRILLLIKSVAFLCHKSLKIIRLILHQTQTASRPCSHNFTPPFLVAHKENGFIMKVGCWEYILWKKKRSWTAICCIWKWVKILVKIIQERMKNVRVEMKHMKWKVCEFYSHPSKLNSTNLWCEGVRWDTSSV